MSRMLWKPDQEHVKNTNMYKFMQVVNQTFDKDFSDYPSLYKWSVDNISDFWETMWNYADIKVSKSYSRIADNLDKMPGTKWFPGARLNFAENLLRYRDDKIAIISQGEEGKANRITYNELYDEVAKTAYSLRKAGVQAGDMADKCVSDGVEVE